MSHGGGHQPIPGGSGGSAVAAGAVRGAQGIAVRGAGGAAVLGAADPRCPWCCRRRENLSEGARSPLHSHPWCCRGALFLPVTGREEFCPVKPQLLDFPGSPLLPQAKLPAGPGACSDPDSRLFGAAGNSWNTEFLQGSASYLQVFVEANSHSLLWLRAHIFIALCILSGLVSGGEMPVFLERSELLDLMGMQICLHTFPFLSFLVTTFRSETFRYLFPGEI